MFVNGAAPPQQLHPRRRGQQRVAVGQSPSSRTPRHRRVQDRDERPRPSRARGRRHRADDVSVGRQRSPRTAYEVYQGRFLSAAPRVRRRPDDRCPLRDAQLRRVVGGPISCRASARARPTSTTAETAPSLFSPEGGATPPIFGSANPVQRPRPDRRMRGRLLRALSRATPATSSWRARHGRRPAGTIFRPRDPIPGNDLRNCPRAAASRPSPSTTSTLPAADPAGAGANYETNRKEGYTSTATTSRSTTASRQQLLLAPTAARRARASATTSSRSRVAQRQRPAGRPSAGDEFGNARGFTMGDTHTSALLVNDARFGVTRSPSASSTRASTARAASPRTSPPTSARATST